MTDPTILDLERLREIYEDDREGIRDLLDLAIQTTQTHLDAVSAAIESHDAPGIRYAAHAIKGASSNVGAGEMARLAAALEHAASASRWDAIPAALAALREGFARLEASIAGFNREG